MDKYKINYIYTSKKDINDIFIKVLNKELQKYLLTNCKNKRYKEPSTLSLEGDKNC